MSGYVWTVALMALLGAAPRGRGQPTPAQVPLTGFSLQLLQATNVARALQVLSNSVATPSTGFAARRSVTVSTVNCGPATNYPVMINVPSNYVSWSLCQSSLADVRWFDQDGFTPLSYYLASNAYPTYATFLVKIPYLAGTGSRTIYLDTINAGAGSASSATATLVHTPILQGHGTQARFLVNEGSGNIIDSSDFPTNATLGPQGTVTWYASGGPGPLNGPYLNLAANSGYLLATNANCAFNNMAIAQTVRCWVRSSGFGTGWLWQKAYSSSGYVGLFINGGTLRLMGTGLGGYGVILAQTTGLPANNVWHQIVCVLRYDYCSIYIDGALATTGPFYKPVASDLTHMQPLAIGVDYRSGPGTIYLNNWPLDVSEFIWDNSAWSPEQVRNDYQWQGRSIPQYEYEKWLTRSPFPAFVNTNGMGALGEATRFRSSADGRWKLILGGQACQLLESDAPAGQYSFYGQVLGNSFGGVSSTVNHGYALDDGAGNLYYYWLTNGTPPSVYWSSSANGGHTFSGAAGVGLSSQMNSAWWKNAANSYGNVAVTHITEGPMANSATNYFMTFDWMRNDLGVMALWGAFCTNYTGNWTIANGGFPLNTLTNNAMSDPSPLYWISGRYRMWTLVWDWQGTTINRASSTDLVNWQIDTPISLDPKDSYYVFDEIGDIRNLLFEGGQCSFMCSLIDDFSGVANYPQLSHGFGYITFQGTPEQLITKGGWSVDFP
nr:DUF2341 domain-containing protein [uncultured Rhodopila sp.]